MNQKSFRLSSGIMALALAGSIAGFGSIPAQAQAQSVSSYTVQRGDSLWAISKKYHVSVAQIKSFNGLRSDTIYPGEKLKLKLSAAAAKTAPAKAAKPSVSAVNTYTVQRGDSLWAISAKYHVSITQIKSLNGLRSNTIYPGQKLRLSGSSSAKTTLSSQQIISRMHVAARTSQMVTVVASGNHAQVQFWHKVSGKWSQVFSANGFVGKKGVGKASEGSTYTPQGAYTLGLAFGTQNPGTALPFRKIDSRSYWISDVKDKDYNTWQERNSSSSADEHLASYPVQYHYAVVINYNTARVRGSGSAFFLHCSNGRPTAGCVSIPEKNMVQLLRALHKGAYIVNVTSQSQLLNY